MTKGTVLGVHRECSLGPLGPRGKGQQGFSGEGPGPKAFPLCEMGVGRRGRTYGSHFKGTLPVASMWQELSQPGRVQCGGGSGEEGARQAPGSTETLQRLVGCGGDALKETEGPQPERCAVLAPSIRGPWGPEGTRSEAGWLGINEQVEGPCWRAAGGGEMTGA